MDVIIEKTNNKKTCKKKRLKSSRKKSYENEIYKIKNKYKNKIIIIKR